jgi:hypothetical protein
MGGYSSYNTIRGELYIKANLKILKKEFEIKLGFNNRTYQLSFDNISDLDAQSVGLFADVAIYPFNKIFFVGVRIEQNANWFTRDSKSRIESQRNYVATSLYTGTCLFLQTGLSFELSDNINVKVSGQPGIQTFKVSSGSASTNGFPIIEDHDKFIYNFNLGIELRLKN